MWNEGENFWLQNRHPHFLFWLEGGKKKITNWLLHYLQWAQRAAPLILPSYRRESFPNSREKGLYINWYGAHSDSKELPDFPRADDLRLNIKRFECVGTVKEMEPWPCVQKREQQKRQKQNQKRLESKVSLIFLWWLLNRSTWDNGRYFKVATSNAQNGKLHAAVHEVHSDLPVQEFHSHKQKLREAKIEPQLGSICNSDKKKKNNNLWAGITKRHFNRTLLLTLLFGKTWKTHYAAQVQPLNGLKSWGGEKKKAWLGGTVLKKSMN